MPGIISNLKQFNAESKHILSVSYKPNMETFRRTFKIVLLGTLALGIMGYIISLIIGLLI